MKTCKHPTCHDTCRRPVKPKKIYQLKRTPIKTKLPAGKDVSLPLKELLQMAQMIFNKWIRKRDQNKPCISAGSEFESGTNSAHVVIQAGHYYSAGVFSGVRFDEMNVNGQSKTDNCMKEGAQEAYREGLIKRYGLAAVEKLDERAQQTKRYKWSREELQGIIKRYK